MNDDNHRISRRFVTGTAAISLMSALGLVAIGCSQSSHNATPSATPNPGTGGTPTPTPSTPPPTTPPPTTPPTPVAGTATLELLISQHDLRVPVVASVAPPLKTGSVAPGATASGSALACTPATGGRVVLVPAGTVVTQMSSIAGVASGSVSADGQITLSNIPTTDQGTSLDAYIDLDGNDIPDGAINVTVANNLVVARQPVVRQRPQSSGLDLGVSLDRNAYANGENVSCGYRGNNRTPNPINATIELFNPVSGTVHETRNVTIPTGTFDLREQFGTTVLTDGEYGIRCRPTINQQGINLSQNGRLEIEVKRTCNIPAIISLIQPNVHEVVDGSTPECLNDKIAITDQYKSGSPLNLRIDITDGPNKRSHFVFGTGYTGTDGSGASVQDAQFAHVTQIGTDEWYIRCSTKDGANTDFGSLATTGDLEFVVRRTGGSTATPTGEEYAATFRVNTPAASPSDKHAPHIRVTRQKNRGDAETVRVGPNQFGSYCGSRGLDNLICESDKYKVFVRAEDHTTNNPNFTSSGLKEVRIEYSTDKGATWTALQTLTPTNGLVEANIELALPGSGKYRVRFTAEDNAGNTQDRTKKLTTCLAPPADCAVIMQELIDYDNTHYGGAAFGGGAFFDTNAGVIENQGGRGYARANISSAASNGLYDFVNDFVLLCGPHDAGSLILKQDPPDNGDRLNEGEDRIITDDLLDGTALPSRIFWRFRPATQAERQDRATPGTFDPAKIYSSPSHLYEFLRSQGRL